MKNSIQLHKWKVERTVQVMELGLSADKADIQWLIFHGYAQDPEHLIPAFLKIRSKDRIIIPEAMSRFYRKGYEGQVVASWMTSRYREDEISDQQAYLNSLYEKLLSERSAPIVVLAFSQGAATALRWLEQNEPKIDALGIYAGWPPDDVDYSKPYWENLNHYYMLGDNDYFIDEQREYVLKKSDYFRYCDPSFIKFIGPHEVLGEVLEDLRERMRSAGIF